MRWFVLAILVALTASSSALANGCKSKWPYFRHCPTTYSGVYQFIGYSTERVNGGQGLLEMHEICQLDFGDAARTCTSREFWLSPGASSPDVASWMHPSAHGNEDFSGAIFANGGSCGRGWRSIAIPYKGLAIEPNGKPLALRCDVERPVACCVPIED